MGRAIAPAVRQNDRMLHCPFMQASKQAAVACMCLGVHVCVCVRTHVVVCFKASCRGSHQPRSSQAMLSCSASSTMNAVHVCIHRGVPRLWGAQSRDLVQHAHAPAGPHALYPPKAAAHAQGRQAGSCAACALACRTWRVHLRRQAAGALQERLQGGAPEAGHKGGRELAWVLGGPSPHSAVVHLGAQKRASSQQGRAGSAGEPGSLPCQLASMSNRPCRLASWGIQPAGATGHVGQPDKAVRAAKAPQHDPWPPPPSCRA